MFKKLFIAGLLVATSGATVAVAQTAPAVPTTAAPTPAACTPVIESGTLSWGLKQSFRSYILGNIAQGSWSTSGAVTEESGKARDGSDFHFNFEVDPATSMLTVDKDNQVTSAVIKTKDSTINFTGHQGGLTSTVKSPYVEVTAKQARSGVGYEGYYVPGKGMTEYTAADRIPANRVSGAGTFAAGQARWQGNNTRRVLTVSQQSYQAQPGTHHDKDTHQTFIAGVDVVFMGIYNQNYKPQVDDLVVDLHLGCAPAPSAPTQPAQLTQSALPTQPALPVLAPLKQTPPELTRPEPVSPTPTFTLAPEPGGSAAGNLMTWLLPVVSVAAAAIGVVAALLANLRARL